MSHPRPGRWDLVHHSSDPAPVDTDTVQELVKGFSETAHDISLLAARLDRLSRLEGWKGKAAETFADKAEDGAHELRKAQKRYDDLAAALRQWVHPVREVRDRTADALRRAEEAEHVRTQNLHDLTAGHPDPSPELQAAEDRRRQRHDEAVHAISRAADAVRDALEDFDDAAKRTADAIDEAAKSYKDGRWANFKGWVRDHADAIDGFVKVLTWVSIGLAAITLAVAMIATAPVWLIAAGLAVAVTMLVAHSALVVADTGKASWLDVGFDLVAIATAGFGLAASAGARSAVTAARASAEARAATQAADDVITAAARTPDAARAAAASRIKDPMNNLFRWQAARSTRIAEEAAQAGTRAAERVRELTTVRATWPRVLLNLDRETADVAAQLKALRTFVPTSEAVKQGLQQVAHARNLAQVGLGLTVHDVVSDRIERVESIEDAITDSVTNQLSRLRWRLTTAGR